MKIVVQLVISIGCLLCSSFSLGQTIEYDTIFIKRSVHTENIEIDTIIIENGISHAQPQILIGTTMLPYSEKVIGLLNKGLDPISLELVQGCINGGNPETFKDYPMFNEIRRGINRLVIEVSVVANCCHNFLGEAEVLGDTLNLLYTSYGGFCGCECCFTLRYSFDSSMEEYYQILNYVTINGSEAAGVIPKKE
jgi:hypothetical protein